MPSFYIHLENPETMSEAKVHFPSPTDGRIAFSWENKPGISKGSEKLQDLVPKLPLPPCTAEGTRNSVHDLQIPLPPCAFQPPYYRTPSKRGLIWMQDDDPFLAAYKECTKSRKKKSFKTGIEWSLRKSLLLFSCNCK